MTSEEALNRLLAMGYKFSSYMEWLSKDGHYISYELILNDPTKALSVIQEDLNIGVISLGEDFDEKTPVESIPKYPWLDWSNWKPKEYKCDCGGEKANTTHAHWCSLNGEQK